jgi:ankyrin repeat protein
MSSALHQSLTLVGYGDHNVFKYCFSCFEQSVSSANVQDDCSISHIFTPAYPDNVWFLKEGNQGLFSAASLLRAAKAGDIDAVKRNLRGHTGINSQDENGRTAILYAAWKGHNDVVSLLAEAHADVNLPDKDGFTACYTASYSGHTNVVDVLLRHGANPNIALAVEPYSVPLEMAATNGHPQTVERLLEGGALINLLRHGTDPNLPLTAEPCSVPLTIAAGNGHLQTVERLADPNLPKTVEPYSVPLEIAATNGHAETVERLLEGGALINHQRSDGFTPLLMASQEGHSNAKCCGCSTETWSRP